MADPNLARAVRKIHSFMLAALFQWIPMATLLFISNHAKDIPVRFRTGLFYLTLAGTNLGGVFNSIAHKYNRYAYKAAVIQKAASHSASTGSLGVLALRETKMTSSASKSGAQTASKSGAQTASHARRTSVTAERRELKMEMGDMRTYGGVGGRMPNESA
ncbi:hypothetical protein HK104_000242 [Borealophlyctis nickersoniae]|nr:hypothetical protein HK104_000242 [Borealophlyctis nickersoniae]